MRWGDHDVVIVEGHRLVYHSPATALLTDIFSLELDKDEARRRRTQARDATLNPNPLSKEGPPRQATIQKYDTN